MGFAVYNGEHSINIIVDSSGTETTINTWNDLHLIPTSRPSIAIPEPRISILQLPRYKADTKVYKEGLFFDATDYLGPLIFGNRTGEWGFIIDHDDWTSWYEAYYGIIENLNGVKVKIQLTDDPDRLYEGYVTVSGYSSDGAYSSVVIKYDLNAKHSLSTYKFHNIRFLDDNGDLIQACYVRRYRRPVCKITPSKDGLHFNKWTPDITTATQDVDYMATYDGTYYTIRFVNYDGTLIKSYLVREGQYPVCEIIPERSGYIFSGWSPSLEPATSDKTYTATFREPGRYLTDTWEQVNESILNGTYRNKYYVGDMVSLNTSGYNDYAQIVAIDTDIDQNDNSIPITWITLKSTQQLYNTSMINNPPSAFYSSMPSVLKNMIVPAKKYSLKRNGSYSSFTTYTDIEYLSLWSPSYREIFGGNEYETQGVIYSSQFISSEARKKKSYNSGHDYAESWWLRTVDKQNYLYCLSVDGNGAVESTNDNKHLVIGFCTKGYSG